MSDLRDDVSTLGCNTILVSIALVLMLLMVVYQVRKHEAQLTDLTTRIEQLEKR